MTGSALTALMILYAAYHGFLILRHWDLSNGSELQLRLERRTYLISTIVGLALVFQLASLFLYVYTVDSLCTLFTGAMCAAGTLNVNSYGYPALALKIANFLLAGVWLIVNFADNKAPDYPLIRAKYRILLALAPLIAVEAGLLYAYFLGLEPDIITSCCGSLFSRDKAGLASDLAAMPAAPMMAAFYAAIALTFVSGIFYSWTGKGGYVFSAISAATSVIVLSSVFSFLSLYIYELPTHHCPFCILQAEYGRIGYPLYGALLCAAVSGLGVGALMPFRNIASLKHVVPALQRRLCTTVLACYAILAAIATYKILTSNLVL
jgi:hypothetical protein